MRLPATAVMVGAIALGAAACGGSGSGGSSGGSGDSGAGAGPVQHPKSLVGDVGKNDAFTISLSDDTGKPISNLAAGSYKLVVHDESGIHNFHLSGSGIDDSTSVGEKTTKTFTVSLKPGDYTFVCDPHASQMNGRFTVS